ncbi:MAG TPA: hypothetical protein VFK92_17810 [Burkholderiales bacterium]|nr:hypothetical protein [Burkholderiales bacterium]
MSGRARWILWLHTLVMGVAGVLFFALPREGATIWPWALPPLAARFVGSLFIGGAACSLACLRSREDRGLFAMVLLALGDALIAMSGLLEIASIGLTPRMIGFLVCFLGFASLLTLAAVPAMNRAADAPGAPVTRALRGFFLIHLLVVLPVGASMVFLPSWAQPLWPWQMTPVNIRLIGSFFLGAAFISLWALRQQIREPLRPVLALYALFASLATIASLIHFKLFDPGRVTTWAFFALYVFVAGGSWLFWSQLRRESSTPPPRPPAGALP